MPRYKILKGNIWVNKHVCSHGEEVFLKEKVAGAFEAGCLELLEEPKPKEKHVFVTQPERNLPKPEEESEPEEDLQIEQEGGDAIDAPPSAPVKPRVRRKKNKKKR